MVLLLVMCAVEMDIAIGITTKSDIAMNEFAYVVSLAGKTCVSRLVYTMYYKAYG